MCVYSDSESDAEGSTFEDEDVRTSQRHPHRRQSYHRCQNCLRPNNASSDDESDLEPHNHSPNVTFMPANNTTVSAGVNSAVGRDQITIHNNTYNLFGENSSSALAFSIGFTSGGLFGQAAYVHAFHRGRVFSVLINHYQEVPIADTSPYMGLSQSHRSLRSCKADKDFLN
ncbi:hypothetical protein BDP27DRAFT_1435385 [Rhodocollybia butyracea]|uniref:Uncharacterized protein n=1 Tax=Rhodocollybia butyracea TaxID=206335 RepID=A0A9P5P6G3_9AGAR|nr:hypothetical protein BDP27DRAFT_1435385 [Rhodocollybia butyracea]